MLGFGPLGASARAGDAPPTSAKARWDAQRADDFERLMWGPPLMERLARWERGGEVEGIRPAVEDALDRFPEPFAVALVVGIARFVHHDVGLDAWIRAVAHRALDRLPRPPRVDDHPALVERAVLGGWRQVRPEEGTDDDPDVGRDLALVARFVRRLLDDEDRLWRPLPLARHDGRYAPVRRTDPRFRVIGAPDTPADEEAFVAYEERWCERTLRDAEWKLLLDVQRQWTPLDMAETFAARFPAASPADAAFRERMPAEVPEFPWIAVLDAARRHVSLMKKWGAEDKVTFRVVPAAVSSASSRQGIGDLELDVLVLNRSSAPTAVPLPLARAAIVYGPHDLDDEALPPPRTLRATDLVTVGPAGLASFRLSLPVRHAGLARIVVALDNDVAKVGEHVGVWTGTERFVGYVSILPEWVASGPERLPHEARGGAGQPDSAERLRREAAALAMAPPDDRAVVPLSLVAIDATDARVAHAALAALETLVANGGGIDAYGAFAPIAADPTRPRDLRLRAVDGLARLAKGRVVSRTDIGVQVREGCDLPIPRRVVDHVRARLAELAKDPDVLVAERARASLVR